MTSLFISYSRKDIEPARKLTGAFKSQDWDFWIDWEGIPPTVDWWKEIERGIEQAGIFLFLLSPDSAASRVCRQELEHALKNNKRLIPVVVRDVNVEEAPPELRPLNWIFLREGDDFDRAFETLITAIRTDYEWVQAHRELQVKALAWQRSQGENSLLLFGKELEEAEHQLATNTSKEPHPTDLQREYVHRSRRVVDRRRARNAAIGVAGSIALAVLAIYGFVQAQLATDRANAALARQLAAQAQTIDISKRHLAIRSALLAVESERRLPSLESNQAMLYALSGLSSGPLKIPLNRELWTGQFSPDGSKFMSWENDGAVHVRDIATGGEILAGAGASAAGPYRYFSYPWLLSPSTEGIRVLDPFSGVEISHLDLPVAALAAISANGKVGVVENPGVWTVWDLEAGKPMFHVNIPEADYRYFWLSPDGGKFLIVQYTLQSEISELWDTRSGARLAQFPFGVGAVHFSPDGSQMAFAADVSGRAVHVWDFNVGGQVFRAEHSEWVSAVAFSPDGKRIVSASVDGTAAVWDVATGKRVSFMQHDGFVHSAAFSPDGKWVISGGDATARIWDPEDGREVSRVTQNEGINWVGFSPDGKRAAAGGCSERNEYGCLQAVLLIWEWQGADLVREICERVPYNLARLQEWSFYLGEEPYRETCPGLPVLDVLPVPTGTIPATYIALSPTPAPSQTRVP